MTPRAVISVLQKEDVVLISRSEVLKGELVMTAKGEGASEDDSATRGHKSESNLRRQRWEIFKDSFATEPHSTHNDKGAAVVGDNHGLLLYYEGKAPEKIGWEGEARGRMRGGRASTKGSRQALVLLREEPIQTVIPERTLNIVIT